jgi:hypothetical protein
METINQPTKTFGEEEKVRILLQEYATLRTEILSRTNNQYQLGAAAVALLVWVIGRPLSVWLWVALGVSTASVAYVYWMIVRDMKKAAARLRELEHEINRRAGETLLVWESNWSGGVAGIWGRSKPLPPKHRDEANACTPQNKCGSPE